MVVPGTRFLRKMEKSVPREEDCMKKKKIWTILAVLAVLAVVVGIAFWNNDDSSDLGDSVVTASPYEESYMAYLLEHGYNGEGKPNFADAEIKIDLGEFTAENGMEASFSDGILSTNEEGKLTWTFHVKTEGFYHLEMSYLPLPGTTSDIQRRILIDNKELYEGLAQLVLKRQYVDEDIRVKNNDEIRPSAVEVFEKTTVYAEDYNI